MNWPEFFDKAPVIRMRDPLAEFLGAAEDGILEYGYSDAVKLAGHSCPTVAGAFLAGRAAVNALYPDTVPERGGIAVRMPAPIDDGVTGVISQVLTLLTGAAGQAGFKGIGSRFARNNLLEFAAHSETNGESVRFERLDTGATVEVAFDPGSVPPSQEQRSLMATVISGTATAEQVQAFGQAWQERVRRLLLEHADDPAVIQVSTVSRAA